MQDVLRTSLAKSLIGLSQTDRLGVAWPIVAGHAIAERSAVTHYDGQTVLIEAENDAWCKQLRAIAPQLRSDLANVSRLHIADIIFVLADRDVPVKQHAAIPGGAKIVS